MRKRNVVLSWLVGIIITVLLALWGTSFALIWGRVCAASMPNSIITNLWRTVRDNHLAKAVMVFLRQMPLYDALCYAFHDADGTLEPLKFILELMGCVSFLIGAVNEVKSTRSFGMLMSDVIYYVFPFHWLIQGPLYALFAITGSYACLKNIGIAAMLCLSGLGVCFGYSLIMAWCLFASPKAKERIVTYYIKGLMTNEQMNKVDAHSTLDNDVLFNEKIKWQRSAGTCVLDYAKYVGQQWNNGTTLQVHRGGHSSQEKLLIDIAVCGLTADTKWLNVPHSQRSRNADLYMVDSFNNIFPDSTSHGERSAEYVLFRKALHFTRDQDVEKLRLDVRRCSQIWEQLFSELENEKRKAQMAHAILSEATSSDWQIFAILAMGLLVYLGIARTEYADLDIKQTLEKKLAFLFDVQLSASDSIPEECMGNLQEFNNAWGEITYLAAGVIQWMVALNCLDEDIGTPFIVDLLAAIQRHVSDRGIAELMQHREKYVVLSYLLFSYENSEKHKELTAYILQNIEPVVCRKLNFFRTTVYGVI